MSHIDDDDLPKSIPITGPRTLASSLSLTNDELKGRRKFAERVAEEVARGSCWQEMLAVVFYAGRTRHTALANLEDNIFKVATREWDVWMLGKRDGEWRYKRSDDLIVKRKKTGDDLIEQKKFGPIESNRTFSKASPVLHVTRASVHWPQPRIESWWNLSHCRLPQLLATSESVLLRLINCNDSYDDDITYESAQPTLHPLPNHFTKGTFMIHTDLPAWQPTWLSKTKAYIMQQRIWFSRSLESTIELRFTHRKNSQVPRSWIN